MKATIHVSAAEAASILVTGFKADLNIAGGDFRGDVEVIIDLPATPPTVRTQRASKVLAVKYLRDVIANGFQGHHRNNPMTAVNSPIIVENHFSNPTHQNIGLADAKRVVEELFEKCGIQF